MNKIKIAILASGNGSNAEKLFLKFSNHHNIEIVGLITNNAKAKVIDKAKNYRIPSHILKNEEVSNGVLLSLLIQLNVNFLILAGFLRKISSEIVHKFPNRILNIHPSLLPKYGGKGLYGKFVHQAVIRANERMSGITIHLVNEIYDQGPIIFQEKCLIDKGETQDSLTKKINKLEHQHFGTVIENYIKNFN